MEILRKIKISKRLVISFFITSLIPLALVGSLSAQTASSAVKSKISTYSVQILEQLENNITTFVKTYEGLSDRIMLNEDVQFGLKRYNELSVMKKNEIRQSITDFIMEQYLMVNEITSIEILTTDKEQLYSFGYYSEKVNMEDYIAIAKEKKGENVWSLLYLKGRDNLVIARQINSANMSQKGIGYLFIIVDEDNLFDLYKNIDLGTDSNVYIMDANGLVVSSLNANNKVGDNKGEILKEILDNNNREKTIFTHKANGKRSLIGYQYQKQTGWYIVADIPYNYLNFEVKQIEKNILLVCMVTIITAIILSFIISRSITTPLYHLVELMKKVQKGTFIRHHVRRGNEKDEIGYLEKNYYEMSHKIYHLLEEIKTEQEKKREAELQVLQAQINPHFLFNTLNSLKWVAMIKQSKTIESGLEALSQLLRNTIVDKKEQLTLKEEINNINNYITIQQIRYGNSFKVKNDIKEEFLNCKILKFLLQPIVENAIIHGLEYIEENGLIIMECYKTGDDLVIKIVDNGQGFNTDKLNQFEKGKLSSIGIKNVDERIKLNYGKKYGLTIKSSKGSGTTVDICIPYLVEEGDQ